MIAPRAATRWRGLGAAPVVAALWAAAPWLAAPWFAGCENRPATLRFDLSAHASRSGSIAAVRKTLSPGDQQRLDDSIALLLRRRLPEGSTPHTDPASTGAALREILDGRTAAQVIADAAIVAKESGVPPPGAGGDRFAPPEPGAGASAPAPVARTAATPADPAPKHP